MAALQFASQAAAVAAVATIDANLGYPMPSTGTTTWDTPRQQKDGTWCVDHPGPAALAGGGGYTVIDGPVWPDPVGSP